MLDLSQNPIILLDQAVLVEGPILGKLSIQKVGGVDVHIRGTLLGKLRLECSRCLTPFVSLIESDFYVDCTHEEKIPAAAGQQEHCLYGEELNLHFYRGDTIDLSEIISDQLRLETPMAPLCKEDCEGLCPSCGEPILQSVCGCSKKTETVLKVSINK